jgi:membrane protein implicated in regulation of membrane protease activity
MAQPRSLSTVTSPPRAHTGTWILVGVLLAAAIVGTLWVPFYNRATPALGGFPFYYWYQLIWVPIVAVLSATAYLLARRAQRDRGTPAPTGTGTVAPPRSGEGEVR